MVEWYAKLVNPVDSKSYARGDGTSYWNELRKFRSHPPSEPGRVSPPDAHAFRLHWKPDDLADAEKPDLGDLIFLTQNLRAKDRSKMSRARKTAVSKSAMVVTHVVEVLDDAASRDGSWHARVVKSWLAMPFALGPTPGELFEFDVGPLRNGLLTKLPGRRKLPAVRYYATWREEVLARLELPHLLPRLR